jgi:hypothetical protein
MSLKTNDLFSGTRVRLRNGWFATIADNKKGNTRLATVEGFYTETGSVYAHDIISVYELTTRSDKNPVKLEEPAPVEHTPAQLKLRKLLEGF